MSKKSLQRKLKTNIYFENLEGIDLCLEQGANINESYDLQGWRSYTPLIQAVCNGSLYVVDHLLKKGADICRKSKIKGYTPLSAAVEEGNLEMVTYLLHNGAQPTMQTAFLTAIEDENFTIIKYMIKKGVYVNWSYKDGHTPLSKALETGTLFIAKFLVQNGARFDEIPEDIKDELIILAVEEGDLDILKYLIKNGANAATPTQGNTALVKAAVRDRFEILKYLLKHRASIDEKDYKGRTALSVAATKRYFHIVKYLIEHGANIKLAQAALNKYAARDEDFDIYFRLFKKNCRLNETLSKKTASLSIASQPQKKINNNAKMDANHVPAMKSSELERVFGSGQEEAPLK